MSRHLTTWILIADGARARIVVPAERGAFRTSQSFESEDAHFAAHELGDTKPGRVKESAASARHAIEPRSDPHERAKDRFAAVVAASINQAAARDQFDRLIVVALPPTLASIRSALEEPARGKLVGEIPKDLTKIPDHALAPHFEALHV